MGICTLYVKAYPLILCKKPHVISWWQSIKSVLSTFFTDCCALVKVINKYDCRHSKLSCGQIHGFLLSFLSLLQSVYQGDGHLTFELKQVCIPVGCIPPVAVEATGGVHIPSTPCPGACWDTLPPWTERLTDKCRNITFPQLHLRAVITSTPKSIQLVFETRCSSMTPDLTSGPPGFTFYWSGLAI